MAFGSNFLRYEVRGGVGWLTIDRPEVKNAMSLEMYRGVGRAVEAAEADDDIHITVITGVDELFITGGGLTLETLYENPDDWVVLEGVPSRDDRSSQRPAATRSSDDNRERSSEIPLPFDKILGSPKTVVSAVNGLCMGGGMLTALSSDITIASDRARFRVPEVLRGIPDAYFPMRLPPLIGMARAKYMMFTAQYVSAEQALDWGLVAEVVPHDDLHARTEELMNVILQGAPKARSVYKLQANRYFVDADPDIQARASADERKEGMSSFAEKRAPSWVPESRRAGWVR